MSNNSKRSLADIREALQRGALHDEAEHVASLSDPELDAELHERGVDAKAARERGAALAARLLAARKPAPVAPMGATLFRSNVVDLAARRARTAAATAISFAAAAAAVGMAVAGVAGIAAHPPTEGQVDPSAQPALSTQPPDDSARREAEALRTAALRACQVHSFGKCRDGLDEASKLDPEGDDLPAVQRAREQARHGLAIDAMALKTVPPPRVLTPDQATTLAAMLSRYPGQRVALVRGGWPEGARFGEQVTSAMTRAGWQVVSTRVVGDDALPAGVSVQFGIDADDATQNAGNTLTDVLLDDRIVAMGPEDPTADAAAPLVVVIGLR
jgi:hypothetical protein